jgi:hypothetical protein
MKMHRAKGMPSKLSFNYKECGSEETQLLYGRIMGRLADSRRWFEEWKPIQFIEETFLGSKDRTLQLKLKQIKKSPGQLNWTQKEEHGMEKHRMETISQWWRPFIAECTELIIKAHPCVRARNASLRYGGVGLSGAEQTIQNTCAPMAVPFLANPEDEFWDGEKVRTLILKIESWDGEKVSPGMARVEVQPAFNFYVKHECLIHHLKIWADRYPFLAEAKGSSMKIRPKKIIVTSNYHPREIWNSESDLGPILRRFSVTRFGTIDVMSGGDRYCDGGLHGHCTFEAIHPLSEDLDLTSGDPTTRIYFDCEEYDRRRHMVRYGHDDADMPRGLVQRTALDGAVIRLPREHGRERFHPDSFARHEICGHRYPISSILCRDGRQLLLTDGTYGRESKTYIISFQKLGAMKRNSIDPLARCVTLAKAADEGTGEDRSAALKAVNTRLAENKCLRRCRARDYALEGRVPWAYVDSRKFNVNYDDQQHSFDKREFPTPSLLSPPKPVALWAEDGFGRPAAIAGEAPMKGTDGNDAFYWHLQDDCQDWAAVKKKHRFSVLGCKYQKQFWSSQSDSSDSDDESTCSQVNSGLLDVASSSENQAGTPKAPKGSVQEKLSANAFANRRVQKLFKRRGKSKKRDVYLGTVTDVYEPGASALYQIVYDDGDEETVYLGELETMLLPVSVDEENPSPKKKRTVEPE